MMMALVFPSNQLPSEHVRNTIDALKSFEMMRAGAKPGSTMVECFDDAKFADKVLESWLKSAEPAGNA